MNRRYPRTAHLFQGRFHSVLVEPKPPWLQVQPTLSRLGSARREQVPQYREFVEEDSPQDPLRDLRYGAFLGTDRFVDQVRGRLGRREEDADVVCSSLLAKPQDDL